nr:DNA methyltransferase [Candidatus Sigynarchaeota archaeon]
MTEDLTEHLSSYEEKYRPLIRVNQDLSRQVVSYQANKDAPFYRWFRYQEGFSAKLVNLLIADSGVKAGTVLDPFAGLGTTLLSARENDIDSIGMELLPVGPFVFKARLLAEQVDITVLKAGIKELKTLTLLNMPTSTDTDFKHVRITEKAFSNDTERKLNAFRYYLEHSVTDASLREIFRFACLSILEKVSFTEKAGQFLRWDSKSGKPKAEYTKTRIYPFEAALFTQLGNMVDDLQSFWRLDPRKKQARMDLRHGSNFELFQEVPDRSIDLVISSPPYLNRYDYTRVYPLELAFLGVDEMQIRQLRQSLLTCTVENREKIDFLKNLYATRGNLARFERAVDAFNSIELLSHIIKTFDEFKQNEKLNNSNVFRLIKNYFFEHSFIIHEMARVLKDGGKIYYINDNVRFAGIVIPVDIILSEIAIKAGLRVKTIFKLPIGKGNSSQQMGTYGKEEVRKCIYVWEK